MKFSSNRTCFTILVTCMLALAAAMAWWWLTADNKTDTPSVMVGQPSVARAGSAVLVGEPADDSLIYAILNPLVPADYRQLVHRVDNLSISLTEAELMAICRALRNGFPASANLAPGERHHVANQLLDVLLRQQVRPVWLAAELIAVWRATKAEETVRDYALQHLAKLLEGRESASSHLTTWRAEGIPVLLAAARDTTRRSSGTAILALHYLSEVAGTESKGTAVSDLEVLIDSIGAEAGADVSARAAAFQAAAARSRPGLLDAARKVAGERGSPSGVRVAAIHYLSVCGESADVGLLMRIEAENDLRYLTASRSARTRILSR